MNATCPLCERTITNGVDYEPSMLLLAYHLHAHHGFANGCACGKGIAMSTGSGWGAPQWLGWHLHNLEEPLDDHLLYHALGRKPITREEELTVGLIGILTNSRTNAWDIINYGVKLLTPALANLLATKLTK